MSPPLANHCLANHCLANSCLTNSGLTNSPFKFPPYQLPPGHLSAHQNPLDNSCLATPLLPTPALPTSAIPTSALPNPPLPTSSLPTPFAKPLLANSHLMWQTPPYTPVPSLVFGVHKNPRILGQNIRAEYSGRILRQNIRADTKGVSLGQFPNSIETPIFMPGCTSLNQWTTKEKLMCPKKINGVKIFHPRNSMPKLSAWFVIALEYNIWIKILLEITIILLSSFKFHFHTLSSSAAIFTFWINSWIKLKPFFFFFFLRNFIKTEAI